MTTRGDVAKDRDGEKAQIDYRFFFWAKRRKRKSLVKRNTPYLWSCALHTARKGLFKKSPFRNRKTLTKPPLFPCFFGVRGCRGRGELFFKKAPLSPCIILLYPTQYLSLSSSGMTSTNAVIAHSIISSVGSSTVSLCSHIPGAEIILVKRLLCLPASLMSS